MSRTGLDAWLAAAVLGHFLISTAHGMAHRGAQVELSGPSAIFVLVVIVLGPILGLLLSMVGPRGAAYGGWLVAGSMAAALLFGFVNHFLIAGPDRVDHVAADWRTAFTTSAALLVVSEVAGIVAGVRRATRPVEDSR
jgi:MFS family permease